jgi:hypothetical protein
MGILVCLFGKRICYTLFSLNNTDDEHAVYTADQLSYYIAYAHNILQRCMCIYVSFNNI